MKVEEINVKPTKRTLVKKGCCWTKQNESAFLNMVMKKRVAGGLLIRRRQRDGTRE
jgi:hypothetical protein